MGSITRVVVLGFAVLALAASAKRWEPFRPGESVAPPDALARAVRVLAERSETIETRDDSAGMIITAWRDIGSGGGKTQVRWTITVGDGLVRVVSQCQFYIDDPSPMASRSGWESCGNQPNGRSGEAQAIADAIAR